MLIGTLGGCSKKEESLPISNVVVSDTEQIIEKNENIVNRFGSDIRRPLNNKIYEDENWSYIKLYDREVRDYSDGSTGYSEWKYLGEFLVKNIAYFDTKREYKYDYISSVNLYDILSDNFDSDLISYFGDSIIALDSVKFYDYSTRDYIDGEYTEWTSDDILYLSDDEYNSSDLVLFKEYTDIEKKNAFSLLLKK